MNISHSVHNIANKLNGLTESELCFLNERVVSLIRQQRSAASKQAKLKLLVGTKVSFTGNCGNTLTGNVTKIMRKFAKVQTNQGVWRVPMHALTTV